MNTILQKRIEEAAFQEGSMYDKIQEKNAAYNTGIKIATFALQNQWISVDESLPDYEEDVIVTNSYDDYWFAHRSNNEKVIVDEYGFARTSKVLRITHWMSIPSLEGGAK